MAYQRVTSKLKEIPTPSYVIDEQLIEKNCQKLADIKEKAGCKILLAQKAFSSFAFYPLISKYLDGSTASGIFEAKLGHEEFGKEVHVYSPAYSKAEMDELVLFAHHINFNSPSQIEFFKEHILANPKIEYGLRLNPKCQVAEVELYDPSAKGSRLGTIREEFKEKILPYVSGFLIHNLCEQNSDALELTWQKTKEQFSEYFKDISWINLGGGHHITKDGYDSERLIRIIKEIKDEFGVEVYLEPGEAIALNTGYLVTEVRDIIRNYKNIAILDTSATAHMPDVIEMPYRPKIVSEDESGEYVYRLGGLTCLAGDVIGDYAFREPLQIGDKLVFTDMAHYTIVKNTSFNGMPLPDIVKISKKGDIEIIKKFSYQDFKNKLS